MAVTWFVYDQYRLKLIIYVLCIVCMRAYLRYCVFLHLPLSLSLSDLLPQTPVTSTPLSYSNFPWQDTHLSKPGHSYWSQLAVSLTRSSPCHFPSLFICQLTDKIFFTCAFSPQLLLPPLSSHRSTAQPIKETLASTYQLSTTRSHHPDETRRQ